MPDGSTNTAVALDWATEELIQGARPAVPRAIVVLTDGVSISTPQTVASAQVAKDDGIEIFAVGKETPFLLPFT